MTHVLGPDFLAIQVRDLQRAADFYERELGLQRAAGSPPGVVAFQTSPIPFAVREPLPGTDLEAGPAGLGVLVSLRADDAQALHDQLKAHGVPILTDPFDTPFGRTFVFHLTCDTFSGSEHVRLAGLRFHGSRGAKLRTKQGP